MTIKYNRRNFIEFIGKGTVATLFIPPFIQSCMNKKEASVVEMVSQQANLIKGILPSFEDRVVLADGLNYQVLLSWNDELSDNERFGFNNDYTCFVPLNNQSDEGLLWVNHEYINPLFVSDYDGTSAKTKEQIDKERYAVGGSICHIKKMEDKWELVKGSNYNRRVTGSTLIPFNWPEKIEGANEAEGTLANCSGGLTPWGSILTCEENYDSFYGETVFSNDTKSHNPSEYDWEKEYPNPPEHYGWVVEVDPLTGICKKHVALGRMAHECATVQHLADGRVVVYTGDDSNDEHLYKFVSDVPNSLNSGKLYVADVEKGLWLLVDFDSQPVLQQNFKSQTDVLIRVREAAKLLGATPLDRPEDIEIDPVNGHVLIALTNNKPKNNYFGSILKIMENDNLHDSLRFKSEVLIAGGEETGFACPDNMAFDKAGNLWFTCDISGSSIGKSPYESFKNNGLFIVPRSGEQEGKVLQIASAPADAEFTGPSFSPDGKTLFLSVQHPGEESKDLNTLTSHWPDGEQSIPRPSVICISGPLLDQIVG